MEGWLKLHKRFLDWEWYQDINVKIVFLHCLLKANFEDKNWRGIEIKRGQFFTSLNHLSDELNLSIKQLRISISKLKKTGELQTEGANNGTKITICKYDNYQKLEKSKGTQKGKRGANEGQTRGKRGATTKEYKNPRIEEIKEYFNEKGYTLECAKRFFDYYDAGDWKDSKGNKVKSWKQKAISMWFKPENRINSHEEKLVMP